MPTPRLASLIKAGSALALLVLVLAGCTPGGQFDPTEVVSGDMFNTKKKLQGDREPVFPNGVPGAETGVPPDLVKGYQPPPEAPAEAAANEPKPAATAAAKPRPKPKPKPQVARAPSSPRQPGHDPAWDQAGAAPSAAAKQPQSAQPPWPSPAPPPQAAQTNWPAPNGQPQQPAASAQTNWPNPPSSAH
jgi:hypothetical protein